MGSIAGSVSAAPEIDAPADIQWRDNRSANRGQTGDRRENDGQQGKAHARDRGGAVLRLGGGAGDGSGGRRRNSSIWAVDVHAHKSIDAVVAAAAPPASGHDRSLLGGVAPEPRGAISAPALEPS